MKTLNFICRGERYEVNAAGQMRRTGMKIEFSDGWKFLGVSFHHWKTSIDITFQRATSIGDAGVLIGGIVWDLDHGTTRIWGGSYNGKLPKITSAWYSET